MENTFARKSPLIGQELETQLKTLLSSLTLPVMLTCIADDRDRSMEMGAFLNHLVSLSPQLSCVFLSPGEKTEYEKAMDADLLPATGIASPGALPRMVFHGIPGGKEISSFASALLTAGGAAKPLDRYTLKDIMKIRRPMVLQTCVSLACRHCAQLAACTYRIAAENPQVTAHVTDANLYPALVEKYNIQRVPLLIVDRENLYPGGKTMAELTTLLSKLI